MSTILLSQSELNELTSYLAQEKASAQIEGLGFDEGAFTRVWLLHLAASKCFKPAATKRTRPARPRRPAGAAR